MAKFKIGKHLKDILAIAILLGTLTGGVVQATKYFARAKELEALDKRHELTYNRLELNISQDILDNKEQDVRWTKQQVVMKRRDDPPTVAEKEIIKSEEAELAEKKKLHADRVKRFEEKYQEAY